MTLEIPVAAPQPHLPAEFPLNVQGGMLEALGINMYTTIGKCLVEFVANAFDGDAKNIDIKIPLDAIAAARAQLRTAAKEEVKKGERDPFKILLTPLPNDIVITIRDDGHGMSPEDVEHKFLPLNRKRRSDDAGNETRLTTEGGVRNVMGRKGLGKLAGFGAAVMVTIRTKRTGETYATKFVMDYARIENANDLTSIRIPATYEQGLKPSEHGTTITLSGLKADAVKHSLDAIRHTIGEAFFGIEPAEMAIKINDVLVSPPTPDYEYVYPAGASREALATENLNIDDIATIPVHYMVAFRARGEHLPVAQRGARIYCNGRLAAGPSLFDLPTGMHNFHSQSYMECIVRADEIDRHGVDLVNTNRTQLRQDNDVVRTLITFIEDQMRTALAHHARWRENQAETELDTAEETKTYVRILERLPSKTRDSARRMLRTLGVVHGYRSEEFRELAPLMIDTMNAGDVLIRLTELGHDPKSIEVIAGHLHELADIEKNDALKLYRGRRSAITALTKLIDRGEHDLWKKKGIEKDLHLLLKEHPWLIKPEYARYLTSDADMSKVSTALAKHLGIDEFAPLEDATRPDLVFVMADSAAPHVLNVVELKSPSIPLDNDHLTQLETYMAKLSNYASTELGRPLTVHGYLIGAMPDSQRPNDKELLLIEKIKNAQPGSKWMVMGVRTLLDRAMDTHLAIINTLEKDLGDHEITALIAPPTEIPPICISDDGEVLQLADYSSAEESTGVEIFPADENP